MLKYPYTLTKEDDENFYLIQFPDIPEALSQGKTKIECSKMAEDALRTALEFYFEDFRTVPEPSEIKDCSVTLPLSFELKIKLLEVLIAKGLNSNSLSQYMGLTKEDTLGLFDLKQDLDIDLLHKAFESLGHNLEISI